MEKMVILLLAGMIQLIYKLNKSKKEWMCFIASALFLEKMVFID